MDGASNIREFGTNMHTSETQEGNFPLEEDATLDNPNSSQRTSTLINVGCQTEFVVIDVDLTELKKRMAAADEVPEALTAESIAAAAQSVLNKSGWVYDQSTRTYFDYNTNLYYYPQTRLYYNYKNGCYYRYNQETQKYEFHYQLQSFKKKAQDSQQQSATQQNNGSNGVKKNEKRLFPNLKKLKYTFCDTEVLSEAKNKGERREMRVDAIEIRNTTYKNQYRMAQKMETLILKMDSGQLDGYLSDLGNKGVKRTCRSLFVCNKCASLTTIFCCQDERIPSSRQNRESAELKKSNCNQEMNGRRYCSDTEIDTLSISSTKYIRCRKCARIALSACCEKLDDIWHKTAATKTRKRKRRSKRNRRNRKRSAAPSSDSSSFTDKDCSSTKNGDLGSAGDDASYKGTFRGDKVDYSFNSTQDSEIILNMEEESSIISCIRAMVTSSQSLKVGTLYLITCHGATIGSSDDCDIQIQEQGVSQKHATIGYNFEQKNYFVTDLGSESGTTLNSTTSHCPGTEAVLATPITHKSVLLLGTSIFVLHLHLGYETCDDCEPGQIQAMLGQYEQNEVVLSLTKEEKNALRRSELKSIKKKYDLHKEQYKRAPNTMGFQYTDRAAERRQTIGSDNPYEKDEMPTSYETELADHNKGHQMLKKMGWSKGKSLGKSQKGITEPIVPQGSGRGKLGLGFGQFRTGGSNQ